MSKYALINTMDSDSRVLGSVLSRHRTIDAANKADTVYQAQVRRANGSTSYIPTIVVELTVPLKDARGHWAYRSQYRSVDRDE